MSSERRVVGARRARGLAVAMLTGVLGGLFHPTGMAAQDGLGELGVSMQESATRLSRIGTELLGLLAQDRSLQSNVNALTGISQPVGRDLDLLAQMIELYELTPKRADARRILGRALDSAARRLYVDEFEQYLALKESSRTFTPRNVQAIESRLVQELKTVKDLYQRGAVLLAA